VMAAVAYSMGRRRPEVLRRAGTVMATGESDDEPAATAIASDPTEQALA
jgi:hypothetical protein